MDIREAAFGVVNAFSDEYNVGFNNSNGMEDETNFDVDNISDLESCWEMFCSEEKVRPDSVTYVEKV